ncbi:hypothetical protein [Planococcus maritimus]|uniref:hypothetical protein n=1 Tax=Planococcus maritimus TaxID=192421 RepID=UPI000B071BBD|nr:hypothetical protein [Planococcus maritimus]
MKKFAAILFASGLALSACSGDSEPETDQLEENDGAEDTMTETEDGEGEEEEED